MKRFRIPLLFGMIVAVALLLAAAGGPVFAGGGNPDMLRGLERAIQVQEKHTERLLDVDGVVGTAVGLGANGSPAVLVLAERAGIGGIPSALDGVPVVVRVTGEIVAQSDPKSRFDRPVPIGISSGSERLAEYRGTWYCTTGTLGARVSDGASVYALSNNHVYAQENDGQMGDRILQPGRADMVGCGTDAEVNDAVIGTLYSYVPIVFSRKANNTVDAAIALTTKEMVGTGTADDGYGTPSSSLASAEIGQPVKKYGRTTGLTTGNVSGINVTVNVGYWAGTARFVNQIIIEGDSGAFSQSGDSGSLIVTQSGNNPVALLFAGSDTITIANPIGLVLDAFGVSIDNGEPVDVPLTVNITDPTDGATVSGSVTVTADARDDQSVTKVEFFVDSDSIGEAIYDGDSWSATWDTTGVSDGSHTLSATATNTTGQTSSNSISVTVDNVADPVAFVHVGDLDGIGSTKGKSGLWEVAVTVTVHSSDHNPIANATVSGLWSGGKSGSVSGTTGSDGTVTLVTGTMKSGSSVTFTVADITGTVMEYEQAANHDPDGESDGTSITVIR